ncbi:hypothetical protein BsWGS_00021 [Bradybaena similaris]
MGQNRETGMSVHPSDINGFRGRRGGGETGLSGHPSDIDRLMGQKALTVHPNDSFMGQMRETGQNGEKGLSRHPNDIDRVHGTEVGDGTVSAHKRYRPHKPGTHR